jgi:hypothetical protein
MDYAALQAAVAGYLNRGDLYGMIPTFVALTEAQVNRVLRSRRMLGRETASVSAEFTPLPDDFLQIDSVTLDGTFEDLVALSPDGLAARKAAAASRSGRPQAYAIVGGALQLFPAPDSACDVVIGVWKSLSPLSTANPSNWLLAAFPDVYLYGALGNAAAFLAPDPRAATWQGLFEAALAAAQADGVKSQTGARPTPISPYVI